MATKPTTVDPMIDPKTGEYAVIAPGQTFRSVTEKIGGVVLTGEDAHRLVQRHHVRGQRRIAGADRGDLAGAEGRRHLGRHHAGRMGLRHHQLRLVDRYRPRRHADLGDSSALQADVAQLDQPLRRSDDDLRRGLRGHVPADPRWPSVAGLLALPVPEHDEHLAAVPFSRWRGTSSRSRRMRRSRSSSGTSA